VHLLIYFFSFFFIIDEHRISGNEFKVQPNMDATNPQGNLKMHNRNLVADFKTEANRSH
jgi:hypothetical protein